MLKVEQTRFLITASHVIDSAKNQPLLVGNSSGFRPIGGWGRQTSLVSGSREDLNDTAVVAVDEDTASFIEVAHASLPIHCVDAKDSFSPGKPYEFFGYPWRKVKFSKSRRLLEPSIYQLKSESIAETDYAPLDLSPHKHIAINFDLKRVVDGNGRVVTAPDPHGMSGGPVWSFAPVQSGGEKLWTRMLAGIFTTHIPGMQILVAVRINAALECIRMMFPNLSSSIPENPKLAIICKSHSHE